MGRAANSRNTRRGLNQTSFSGRMGSVGNTQAAYAIRVTDSSVTHRCQQTFSGLLSPRVGPIPRRRSAMAKKGKAKKRPVAKAKRHAVKKSVAKKKARPMKAKAKKTGKALKAAKKAVKVAPKK